MRFLIGGINHETNTFSNLGADHDAFLHLFYYQGQEVIGRNAGTRSVIGGVIDVAREQGIDLVPTLFSFAMPSGAVLRDEFEAQMDLTLRLVDQALAQGPIDGVILALHGAMVIEGVDDGEGEYLRRLRGRLGAETPIGVVFDFHANISQATLQLADVLVGYDTYPHIDGYERAIEVAGLVRRIAAGDLTVAQSLRQVPLLLSPSAQYTRRGPMADLMAQCHAIEARPGVLTATVAGGFPFADVADAGLSVYVATDDDPQLARQCADELAAFAWANRQRFLADLQPVDTAVRYAMTAPGPVLLADVADNTGIGAAGDGTVILKALIRLGARSAVVALVYDPETVEQAIATGVGGRMQAAIGGKVDDRHGPTVHVEAYVRALTDGYFVGTGPMATGLGWSMGRTAVLEIGGRGGIEVVCTDHRHPPNDSAALRSVGVDPTQRQIVVLKSSVHFRADFETQVREIIEVDGPGLSAPNWAQFDFIKVRRPIYPIDTDFDWSPGDLEAG